MMYVMFAVLDSVGLVEQVGSNSEVFEIEQSTQMPSICVPTSLLNANQTLIKIVTFKVACHASPKFISVAQR